MTVNPSCSATGTEPDAMGYHDAREIPNYWTYAHQFVLQDRMFEPNASWSLPAHLFTLFGWSARSANADPMSCSDPLQTPNGIAFLLLPPARRTGPPQATLLLDGRHPPAAQRPRELGLLPRPERAAYRRCPG